MHLLRFLQSQKSAGYPGLVIVLQVLTGKREQDSGRSQEPEVTRESSESFVSDLLVNLLELLKFLEETEVGDGSIGSDVGCEEVRDVYMMAYTQNLSSNSNFSASKIISGSNSVSVSGSVSSAGSSTVIKSDLLALLLLVVELLVPRPFLGWRGFTKNIILIFRVNVLTDDG